MYLIIREVEYLQTSTLGWQLSVHVQVHQPVAAEVKGKQLWRTRGADV